MYGWEGAMLERINSLQDRYWGSHSRLFENVTHVIGGVGIGLLAASKNRAANRRYGRMFLVVSAAMHLYAFVTAQGKTAGR
jgi:hypothetical protein